MTAHSGQKMLVAMRADLGGAQVPLYAPVRVHPDVDCLWGVTLLRGNGRFVAPVSPVVRADGQCFIDARCRVDGEQACRYLVMREVATFDCELGMVPAKDLDAIYGATSWERCEVSTAPGLYYVVGRDARDREDCLMGPFLQHVAALARVDEARDLVSRRDVVPAHVNYGVARFDGDTAGAPRAMLGARARRRDDLGVVADAASSSGRRDAGDAHVRGR